MTEASVDGLDSVDSELRSDSRLLILLGSPDGIKSVSKRLSSLQDSTRVRRGLFIVHDYSKTHEELLSILPYVSFIKTREIPTLRERMKHAHSARVYSLVAFTFKSPTAQQKKHVERLIRRATCIRLRPGVFLFPLLRSKEQRRLIGSEDNKQLIDSTEFTRLIRKNGGHALRWSRIRITNPDGGDLIDNAVQHTLTSDLNALEGRIQTLRERLKDSAVDVQQLKRNYTSLSRSFRELKTKWIMAKKLWFYDSEKALRRTYNMLVITRRAIISVESNYSD